MIILGGLLTIFVIGTVDSGGMSAVVQKAKIQDHFQRDSFSFRPTHQVIKFYRMFQQVLVKVIIFIVFQKLLFPQLQFKEMRKEQL